MLSSLVNGNKMIYPYIFPDTLSTIKAIHNEKATALKGSPVIFIDLINHPDLKKYDLSSLETILIGASTVPNSLLVKIKKVLNIKNVLIGYAMTETGCAGSLTKASDIEISEKFAYETIGKGKIF